jgi:uncharacterized protein involved in outer membrane biogenesis
MSRRGRVVLVSVAALLVLFGIFLAVLPMIVRSVAVDRLTRLTGRTVTLADVDLNIFTGRVALKSFGISQRGSPAPAFEAERLDVQVALTSLATSHLRIGEIVLTAPGLHVARLGPGQFDFDDLLALIPTADPNRRPSETTMVIQRLALTRGLVVVRDAAVTPAATWRVEDLTIDGQAIGTQAGRPGRLTLRARVNGSPLAVEADSVDVAHTGIAARISLGDFALAQAVPYVPPTVAVLPAAGRATLALQVRTSRADKTLQVSLGGDVRLDELALQRRGSEVPFL